MCENTCVHAKSVAHGEESWGRKQKINLPLNKKKDFKHIDDATTPGMQPMDLRASF